MAYYTHDNSISIACCAIRDRIQSSEEYRLAFEVVVGITVNRTRGKTVAEMREMGGYSRIISEAIDSLPDEFKRNCGSEMIQDSVADALRDYTQDIRLETCQRITKEKNYGSMG